LAYRQRRCLRINNTRARNRIDPSDQQVRGKRRGTAQNHQERVTAAEAHQAIKGLIEQRAPRKCHNISLGQYLGRLCSRQISFPGFQFQDPQRLRYRPQPRHEGKVTHDSDLPPGAARLNDVRSVHVHTLRLIDFEQRVDCGDAHARLKQAVGLCQTGQLKGGCMQKPSGLTNRGPASGMGGVVSTR